MRGIGELIILHWILYNIEQGVPKDAINTHKYVDCRLNKYFE